MQNNISSQSIQDNDPDRDIIPQVSNPLIAESRIYARAAKTLTLAERKTLIYALSMLRYTDTPDTCVIYVDKRDLAEYLGIHPDTDHLSVSIHNAIKDIIPHSVISFAIQDRGLYDDGALITRVLFSKNNIRIKFEPEYLDLFTNLEGNYITLLRDDIQKMSSIRSINFYEYLRSISFPKNNNNSTYTCTLSTSQLQHLFGLPQYGFGSYIKKDGCFDRNSFNRKCILPVCQDLEKCTMIKLIRQPNDKLYLYNKTEYTFRWTCTLYPLDQPNCKYIPQKNNKKNKNLHLSSTWDINNPDADQYNAFIRAIEHNHNS